MPEAAASDNKTDKKSHRFSSSDDETGKQPDPSIDKKEEQIVIDTERSSQVRASKTEQKPAHGHQRKQLLSPHRTSYNAEGRSSKDENPFNLKRGPSIEKKNSGMTQQAEANPVHLLAENRNSVSN